MKKFPFDEVQQFATFLKQLADDPETDNYVYTIEFEPNRGRWRAHVNYTMFERLVPASWHVDTSFLEESHCVHFSAQRNDVTFVACIHSYDMAQSLEDRDKPLRQLYQEWAKRTGWPYI